MNIFLVACTCLDDDKSIRVNINYKTFNDRIDLVDLDNIREMVSSTTGVGPVIIDFIYKLGD